MMTLAALRKITWYIPYMQDGGYWNPPVQGDSLFERKVGLHGLGGIAQEFVKLLKPFGCDISAYSPNCPDEVLTELGVKRQNDLAALYAENDVVSVHAALTEKTRGMVTKEILSGMQENAVLVNTARGAVIDEAALTDLVLAGKIWAALDVFENEPLAADSPLRNCDRCLVMPHVAGPTLDRMRDMGLQALANLTRYVNGEEVLDTISARKYDLMT
jgi:phosphoglycerate dehydrogenase-like enzyme